MDGLQELFASLETDVNADVEAAPAHSHNGRFTDAAAARTFVMAGNATITLVSARTQARYTFKVQKPEDGDGSFLFVSLLTGPDNWTNYKYFGYLRRGVYFHGKAKAKVAQGSPGEKAFAWAWTQIARGSIPDALEVWHEGKCGRCGRKLTVPSSVASGFGPECINHVGG